MLEVALWMIGSAATCPHCSREIVLSLGEDSGKYFPDSPKQTAILKTASRKAGGEAHQPMRGRSFVFLLLHSFTLPPY